eukprot:261926-Alexandrium_andersonii.AAC.1
MPANLPLVEPLQGGAAVPGDWLAVDQWGVAGRFNAGACLLEPDLALLEYIAEQAVPSRDLCPLHEDWPDDAVRDVFGAAWR